MNDDLVFLEAAARYFEARPTNGEDAAHWSNGKNAENCRRIADEIIRLRAELAEAEARGYRRAVEDAAVACEVEADKCDDAGRDTGAYARAR